jgi:hypothetical protein
MDANDEQQIKHYYMAEMLLGVTAELLSDIHSKRVSGSAVEVAHARLTHLESQAATHALLAGIRLPARTEEEA